RILRKAQRNPPPRPPASRAPQPPRDDQAGAVKQAPLGNAGTACDAAKISGVQREHPAPVSRGSFLMPSQQTSDAVEHGIARAKALTVSGAKRDVATLVGPADGNCEFSVSIGRGAARDQPSKTDAQASDAVVVAHRAGDEKSSI